MIAPQPALAGNLPSTTALLASKAPAQRATKIRTQPFGLRAALNQASLWFSESRTTWATAGRPLN